MPARSISIGWQSSQLTALAQQWLLQVSQQMKIYPSMPSLRTTNQFRTELWFEPISTSPYRRRTAFQIVGGLGNFNPFRIEIVVVLDDLVSLKVVKGEDSLKDIPVLSSFHPAKDDLDPLLAPVQVKPVTYHTRIRYVQRQDKRGDTRIGSHIHPSADDDVPAGDLSSRSQLDVV